MAHSPRGLRFGAALTLAVLASVSVAHEDITPSEAQDMILSGGVVVVDVREYFEFCGSTRHIADAANLPWNSAVLTSRFGELPTDVDVIVVCASGNRSNAAANFLDTQGFTNIHDMLGGMGAWAGEREACDPAPVVRMYSDGLDVWINWTPTAGPQDYDLLRGDMENLSDDGSIVDLGPTTCLADDSAFTYSAIPMTPPAGTAFFYLARQRGGSWGESSQEQQRAAGFPSCK